MIPEKSNLARRSVMWALVIHTGFVVIAVALKQSLWGVSTVWWHADRILRIVDSAVLWVVDPLLQKMPLLPPEIVLGRIGLAAGVNETVLYASFGGAFYAVVVGTVAFLIQRKRLKTGLVTGQT